jgi:hypothetical protein
LNAKNLFRTTLSFLLAGFFLYFAFRGVNSAQLWGSLMQVRYGWVLPLVPIALLSHWVRAIRWSYLLSPVKPNTSLRNLFSAVMIGYAVNNLLPRIGELFRPVVVGKLEQISRSAAFGTVVVERILDAIAFCFIASIVLTIYPHALDPLVSNPDSVRPFLLLISLGALGVFLLLFFKLEVLVKAIQRVKKLFSQRIESRIDGVLEAFISGFGIAKMTGKLGAVAALSLLMWLLYAMGMYIPFFAFDSLRSLNYDFGAAVLLLVITSIAWILPAPGAMGTYHSFLTVALTKLYDVDPATALSFSIITHEVGYIVVMVVGGYYFFHDHVSFSAVAQETTRPPTHSL